MADARRRAWSRAELRRALAEVAREASSLYDDRPLDYKGRPITGDAVLGTADHPWHLDVIEGALAYAPGPRLLEVGLAFGVAGTVLARWFDFELHGLDHPDNLDVYCRFPRRQGVDVPACGLHFDSVLSPDGTFDLVVASEITKHLFRPPAAWYPKLARVLRPGGRLIVTTPNFARLRNIMLLLASPNPSEGFSADPARDDPPA